LDHPNAEVPRAALPQIRPSATLIEDRNFARELSALGDLPNRAK